jgi:hypothetical protein
VEVIDSFTQKNILNALPPPDIVLENSPLAKRVLDGPCFHCLSERSETWHKLPLMFDPTGMKKQTMCDPCRDYWLHYAILRPISGQQLVSGIFLLSYYAGRIKRKRAKSPSVPPEDTNEIRRSHKKKVQKAAVEEIFDSCAVCTAKFSVKDNKLLKCVDCGLSVHQACFGAYPENEAEFSCSRCENKRDPEAAIVYNCILCPYKGKEQMTALKKTIGSNWVHQQCAIFLPEVFLGCLLILGYVWKGRS